MIRRGLTISFIFAALVVIVLSSYTYYITSEIASLNSVLDRKKLKYEALLSEKLSIEKSLMKARKRLSSIKVSQGDLSARLSSKRRQLQEEINANQTLTNELVDARKALADSQAQIDSLMRTSEMALDDHHNVEIIISQLKDSLALSRAGFQNQREYFERQPSLDNVEVEALRDKRIIAHFPRRANAIAVSLDLPIQYSNLSYEVSGPDGLNENSLDGNITVMKLTDDQPTASLKEIPSTQQRQQIRITYSSHKRLKPGKYTFTVLNDGRQAGSVHVNLERR